MCELCDRIKSNEEYRSLISRMHESDIGRLEHSKIAAASFSSVDFPLYSTIEYPKLLVQPLLEAKVAFATPVAYFQNLLVNGNKLPGNFSHGATRSVFFIGKRLMLMSKSTASHEAREFFSSFVLAHFEPDEYTMEIGPEGRLSISVDAQKTARNLLTGKTEKIQVSFLFMQDNLTGKILRKNDALGSTLFVNQFKRAGVDARTWLTSTDYMFEYVVSVAHFSPHPYMMKVKEGLGYSSQQDFQNGVLGYFRAHLKSV